VAGDQAIRDLLGYALFVENADNDGQLNGNQHYHAMIDHLKAIRPAQEWAELDERQWSIFKYF
jgi:hypothetical protein